MKKIYFASTNKGKIASIRRDFEGSDIEVESVEIEIPEPRSDETRIIAGEKVRYAFEHIKKPCIAQDGGFYIPSLNGFPKAFVNFVMGTIGLDGILKLVEGRDRHCEFRDTLAYLDETLTEPVFFETITKGIMTEQPRGELHEYNWGQLHKIFIPEGETRTFSEMSAQDMEDWRKIVDDNWCGKKFALWLIEKSKNG